MVNGFAEGDLLRIAPDRPPDGLTHRETLEYLSMHGFPRAEAQEYLLVDAGEDLSQSLVPVSRWTRLDRYGWDLPIPDGYEDHFLFGGIAETGIAVVDGTTGRIHCLPFGGGEPFLVSTDVQRLVAFIGVMNQEIRAATETATAREEEVSPWDLAVRRIAEAFRRIDPAALAFSEALWEGVLDEIAWG